MSTTAPHRPKSGYRPRTAADHLPRPEGQGRSVGKGLLAGLGLLLLVVGVPAALILFVGNPLPSSLPDRSWLVLGVLAGLVLVGLGEGVLLGVVYYFAGVPHPVLFGALTAVAAMIPFGAPLVFGIAALILLAGGAVIPAAVVVAAGFVVTFVADHFVRPVLIGGDFNTSTFDLATKGQPPRVATALAEDPLRLVAPMRYEPMFEELRARGYDATACNVPLAPTQRTRPDGTSQPPFGKIDWLFARDLVCTDPKIVPAVDEAGQAISDHEVLVVTIAPSRA